MSLHFYRGPKDRRRRRAEITEDDTARLLEQAKEAKKWIPAQLSFEEIIKNRTLPPCSLNDFMDYLMYVERSAENLQFILWYCDYLHRWTAQPPEEKALAPKWDPEQSRLRREKKKAGSGPGGAKHARRNPSVEEKAKLGRILDILDRDADKKHAKSMSSSTASTVPRFPEAAADGTEGKWVPYSSQPFRDEVNKVVRHYITSGAPRQMRLSKKDRTACLHAIEHTTHPSALLPAVTAAEAVLRGESHPNFVRWSVANANRPMVFFLRAAGAMSILLGLALDAVLVLSSWSRFWRLAALPLFIMGVATLVAAWDGLSLGLYLRDRRQVRPWDQAVDLEAGGGAAGGMGGGRRPSLATSYRKHSRAESASSVFSAVDPLRKPGLQSFGPRNDGFADEPWAEQYARKLLLWRVWDLTASAQSKNVRALQGKVARRAAWSAAGVSVVLAVATCLVPSFPMIGL